MTVKITPEYTVQTLVDDEDLRADFADLIPKANDITDAASKFISAADKMFGGKNQVYGNDALILGKTVEVAQKAVKYGAAISKLLRNPIASRVQLGVDQPAQPTQGTVDDEEVIAEVVHEITSGGSGHDE
ncbi:hypothetical protein [Bifidobacterium biavatii]|uniref:Uncharacterized protein n=1 Tax=Bifidobacterium biavatii DSM 23969 TaxID=1437608 RepID=A0A086ZYX2_9BIFI|nr:hypothetical protein [Bifidobacterium biavatii]KFI51722.1 hypothetical protein BBIA_0636 [Bifidobacterium biavatii DSM 23969]